MQSGWLWPRAGLRYLHSRNMDSRGIINFRCWALAGRVEHRWDSLSNCPVGGRGHSLSQEGTGVVDSLGKEMFRGDIVNWSEAHFLIGYKKGGYQLLQLDGEWKDDPHDVWLHDCPLEEISVVGNSHDNSDFVVQCINRRARSNKVGKDKMRS